MKNYLILIFLSIISSCSVLSTKKNENYKYIVESKLRSTNVEEVEKALTQKSTMGGGNYIISVIPLTRSLLVTKAQEVSLKTGLDENEVLNEYLDKFSLNKTCFEVKYTIVETPKVKDLTKWKFNFIDQNEISHDLDFVTQSSSIRSSVGRGFRKVPQWLGAAHVCSSRKLILNYGFDFKIKVNFVAWPFSDELILTWIVIDPNEEEVTTRKKKKIQKYRGW